jgi:flagellar motor switch protein FliN
MSEMPTSSKDMYSNFGGESGSNKGGQSTKIDMIKDVSLQLAVELGRTRMTVKQVLDLQKGSVVELNRMAGDAVDIYVNDHLIARGEVVVVEDKFGVRITELITPNKEEGEF